MVSDRDGEDVLGAHVTQGGAVKCRMKSVE